MIYYIVYISVYSSRVKGLMTSGETVIGGETDEKDNYIAPTIVINVKATDPVMENEVSQGHRPSHGERGKITNVKVTDRHEERGNIINVKATDPVMRNEVISSMSRPQTQSWRTR